MLSEKEYLLKKKIYQKSIKIKNTQTKITSGMKTGYNTAFLVTSNERLDLIDKSLDNKKIIVKAIMGSSLSQYWTREDDLFLLNLHNGYQSVDGVDVPAVDINMYPYIKNYLDKDKFRKFKDDIGLYKINTKYTYAEGHTPYNLRNCACIEDFENYYIAWKDISDEPAFSIVERDTYLIMSASKITSKSSLKFLLAVLNSSITKFIMKSRAGSIGEKGTRYFTYFVEDLPIPDIQKK